MDISVQAPSCIDIVLRKKGPTKFIHCINRTSGLPGGPRDGTVAEIPSVGPLIIRIRQQTAPKKVKLAFERTGLSWKFKNGLVQIKLDEVKIHLAVAIENKYE